MKTLVFLWASSSRWTRLRREAPRPRPGLRPPPGYSPLGKGSIFLPESALSGDAATALYPSSSSHRRMLPGRAQSVRPPSTAPPGPQQNQPAAPSLLGSFFRRGSSGQPPPAAASALASSSPLAGPRGTASSPHGPASRRGGRGGLRTPMERVSDHGGPWAQRQRRPWRCCGARCACMSVPRAFRRNLALLFI
ncbi:unnamed protein product [Coccothraustes coccothraustes]